jgi:hypothetical protein
MHVINDDKSKKVAKCSSCDEEVEVSFDGKVRYHIDALVERGNIRYESQDQSRCVEATNEPLHSHDQDLFRERHRCGQLILLSEEH